MRRGERDTPVATRKWRASKGKYTKKLNRTEIYCKKGEKRRGEGGDAWHYVGHRKDDPAGMDHWLGSARGSIFSKHSFTPSGSQVSGTCGGPELLTTKRKRRERKKKTKKVPGGED